MAATDIYPVAVWTPKGLMTCDVMLMIELEGWTLIGSHSHALVLDGVYTSREAWRPPSFRRARPATSVDVAEFATSSRILRLCRRRAPVGEEGELEA